MVVADKHRIGKVTTRAGDGGKTKLATGRTAGKHEPVFQIIGSVDELNSHLGMLISLLPDDEHRSELQGIQQALFDIGAVLAMEGKFAAPEYSNLEGLVEALNAKLPPLTEFVLPGGGQSASQSHICRTVCRRAETDIWRLISQTEEAADEYFGVARYLNRLSDYFFVLARTLTATTETQWQGPSAS